MCPMHQVRRDYFAAIISATTTLVITCENSLSAPRYHYVELAQNGIQGDGYSISPTGTVVGTTVFSTQFSDYAATVWYPDGSSTILGETSDHQSDAWGVNSSGDIVGTEIAGRRFAILWRNEERFDLPGLGGSGFSAAAYGINEAGVVCGASTEASLQTAPATIWIDMEPIEIGLLPGSIKAEAFAISNNDVVVGQSGGSEAFRWESGVMEGLGTLGGLESTAVDVNNLGNIVGWAEFAGSNYDHAVRWNDREIASLYEPPDTLRSFAMGINDYDEIVGKCDSSFSAGFPALWIGDRLYDLNELILDKNPPVISGANDINDRGQITGWSGNSDIAFRLDPVFSLFDPEPGVAAENNALRIFGSKEGNRIVFIYGFQEGSVNVPGCQGLTVDIRNPRLAGMAVANEDGRAQITGIVPGAARGRTTRLQAVDLDACTVTPVFDWTWE